LELSQQEIENMAANCNLDSKIITKEGGLFSDDSDEECKPKKRSRR